MAAAYGKESGIREKIMELKDYEEVVSVCDIQEKMLRAEHFCHKDMLSLGNFVVSEAERQGVSVAVSVTKPGGAIVYQHLMEGTGAGNQNWIRRKTNVCAETEHCTLRSWAKEVLTGETLYDWGMNDDDYVFSGGAFPIRLTSGEFAGILSISGFAHFKDHQFGVDCLAKWLGTEGVPAVPFHDVWRE